MGRIMLVDDDKATLDLVHRALALDGHDVVATQDAHDALEQLRRAPQSFDLLMTDVEMPGLDGISLANAAVAAAGQLRVVVMSGFAAGLARAGEIKAQGVRFIEKPFTLEQIRAEIRAALA